MCCCHQHQIWCCPHKFMCWFWPSWIKKFSLCMLFFSEQEKSASCLPVHFLHLILSLLIPGDEIIHISGLPAQNWEQQTGVLTYLSFSQTTIYLRQIDFPELYIQGWFSCFHTYFNAIWRILSSSAYTPATLWEGLGLPLVVYHHMDV